jgi:hypothetical protein
MFLLVGLSLALIFILLNPTDDWMTGMELAQAVEPAASGVIDREQLRGQLVSAFPAPQFPGTLDQVLVPLDSVT